MGSTLITLRSTARVAYSMRLGSRLSAALDQLLISAARRRALRRFAARNPEWAESLFDEHFLRTAAAPLLGRCLTRDPRPTPGELAEAWALQLGPAAASSGAVAGALPAAAEFLRIFQEELAAVAPEAGVAGGRSVGQPGEMELFSAAVRGGSNMEMDWLWLATRVESEGARRYCYERALYINPDCQEARRALDAMDEERERTRAPWLRIVRERAQGESSR